MSPKVRIDPEGFSATAASVLMGHFTGRDKRKHWGGEGRGSVISEPPLKESLKAKTYL